MEDKIVEIGTHRVVIDKLFGPTVFAKLRITPDLNRGWVIEREAIDTGEWHEEAVIDAQRDAEFPGDPV